MRRAFACLLLAAVLTGCGPSQAKDEAAILGLMRSTWDRPDSRLDAGPVVVAGDSAVADWTQGSMGGRALLERRDGRWRVVLCAGDVLRSERGLGQVGLHPAIASTLASKLSQAERDVPAVRLAAMARFRGIVPMEGAT